MAHLPRRLPSLPVSYCFLLASESLASFANSERHGLWVCFALILPFAVMITSSAFFFERNGTPDHSVGDLLHTHRIFGLSRVRTEPLPLARNLMPSATSSRDGPPAFVPSPTWRFPVHIAKCRNIRRQSGSPRTLACAASTSEKRSRKFPCLLIWPSPRPLLDSPKAPIPHGSRSACHKHRGGL
jgi:hypothetical protein